MSHTRSHNFEIVTEDAAPELGLPAVSHPGWRTRFPWLVQGMTTRGGDTPFDMGIFAGASGAAVFDRWTRLRESTGAFVVVHGRQVHGRVVRYAEAVPEGLFLVPATDGFVTEAPGRLLAVATADCVPVTVVDAESRAVALLHAGWRGTAAGILERGVAVLQERVGSRVENLLVHLGPAICRDCYEVGPEVFEALGEEVPSAPSPVDLRGNLARRAMTAGVAPSAVSLSAHCSLCDGSPFFSHRGGDVERQVAFVGVRR